jgi:hypothetical protein
MWYVLSSESAPLERMSENQQVQLDDNISRAEEENGNA